MKVLVTGAAGLIGSNFCALLGEKGIAFVGVDNFTPNYDLRVKDSNWKRVEKLENSELLRADILDSAFWQAMRGKEITHIVHLAARAGVRESTVNPAPYLETNILGTLRVLEFARENNVAQTVLASTSSVYGKNKTPFRENMKIDTPLSIYASSKIGMEQLAYSFHHLHKTPITILRFFTVYGPGGRPDMAVFKFVDSIYNGEQIEVFSKGLAKRDFTYVGDVVDGVFRAMGGNQKWGIFNIGNSKTRSVNDLISIIEKTLGKKANKKMAPARPEDVDKTLSNISLAKKKLGYKPKTSLESGIRNFVNWYLEYRKNA